MQEYNTVALLVGHNYLFHGHKVVENQDKFRRRVKYSK
jgi:hypothetical protein